MIISIDEAVQPDAADNPGRSEYPMNDSCTVGKRLSMIATV